MTCEMNGQNMTADEYLTKTTIATRVKRKSTQIEAENQKMVEKIINRKSDVQGLTDHGELLLQKSLEEKLKKLEQYDSFGMYYNCNCKP